MTPKLPFPLYSGFFPQIVLTVEELMHYRRLSKERVTQLVRIIEDADCVYRWTDIKAHKGRYVQKAQFLDIYPTTKQVASKQPSTLYKCSAHIVDVQPEEILEAIANVKTRDARKAMKYLHGDEVVDTKTLLTFPTSSKHMKPRYSYRAIKWSLLKARRREGQKSLDFCYLEYAGKCKAQDMTNCVVGYCIQESIDRDREVPTLERYDILRGQLVRSGIVITKTHQSNILKITAIAQIDGAMEPTTVRVTMQEIMVDFVAAVHRVKGLLERQRMGRLQNLEKWDWVSTKDRKACAVCLRGFYFHRKHHCATCGEVVCANCAPLREPLDKHAHCLRVCSLCMAQAGSRCDSNLLSGITSSENDMLDTATSTTNIGTETYVGGLRYPKHLGMQRESIEESLRGLLPAPTQLRSPLPPFQQRCKRLSVQENYEDASNAQFPRATSESARREQRSSVSSYLTLCSSRLSAHAKKKALDTLVEYARQIRDTINIAVSEAEEEEERHSILLERGSGDPHAGAERYDKIFDRIMKVRETLDISSSDFDAVLKSISHNDIVCSSNNSTSDRLDSDLAFSFSEETGSEHRSTIESESIEFYSSRSSLLSPSVQSLNHQDAGEPLPSPTPEEENAVEEARALEEALQWVRQSQPTATLRPFCPAPSMRNKIDDHIDAEPLVKSTPTPSPIVSESRKLGTERLAHKIGRLHQRLEITQRKSEATSSEPMSVVTGPVTSTSLAVPAAMDERDNNVGDEPEPEKQPIPRRSVGIPALKLPRGSAVTNSPKEEQVDIADGAAPPFSLLTARRELSLQSMRLSEPSRAPPDLVARLRGVMNSCELTHAPPRRRPGTGDLAAISETPSNSSSLMSAPSRNSCSGRLRRAPLPPPPLPPPIPPRFNTTRPSAMTSAAPTPAKGTTLYVYDPEDRFQKVHRRSFDQRSLKASEAMEVRPGEVPSSKEDNEEGHGRFGICLSSSNEEQRQAHTSAGATALPPARALGADRRVRACDESGELRELMEGLAKAPLRSRCSSGQSTGAPPTENFDL
ncbi:unnamed protein product [Peronospora belbahrii]|uniref:FYVE-type domain-containing protein n=1 Tax=Peronospora belbahrii TaxID=622444 RepID=A0AAU9L0B4_9STRA|nr:unnamed protein product [Peronospora belbahrii]CAH0514390.1 unnamed protein product [Peronospora belbahrii]